MPGTFRESNIEATAFAWQTDFSRVSPDREFHLPPGNVSISLAPGDLIPFTLRQGIDVHGNKSRRGPTRAPM